MLKENDQELKYELLKIILSNPANKIMEVNSNEVDHKLSVFIQTIRKPESLPEAKP